MAESSLQQGTLEFRAESLELKLRAAKQALRLALQGLNEVQDEVAVFFDDLEMDPDEGTYDSPPKIARGLRDLWVSIPSSEEIDSLFGFTD